VAAPPHPLYSGAPSGPGWVRAPDKPPPPGEPPHGAVRPDWDPGHAAFDPSRVDPSAAALWQNPTEPYGRGPLGAPYTDREYAERFHKLGPKGEHQVAWPPNQGAIPGRKADYFDAQQYFLVFGDGIDRMGPPSGAFTAHLGWMEDVTSAPYSYEARALHYESLYKKTPTYTLIPGMLPPGWTIRVMDTAPALGQPGRSVSLVFLDDTGKEISVTDLLTAGVLR
jgi:hypothetical protein